MAAAGTSADAYVYWAGTRVGKFTSVTQSTERSPLETTALGDTHATYQPGGVLRNSFSGSLLYDPGDTAAIAMLQAIDNMAQGLQNHGKVKLEWLGRSVGTAGDIEGDAVITSRSHATSVGELQTISIEIQFTGAAVGGY